MAWYLYKAAQGVSDPGTHEPVSMDMVSDGETSSASEDETALESRVEDLVARLGSLANQLGQPHDSCTLSSFVSTGNIGLQLSDSLRIHDSGANTTRFFHSS